MTFNGMVNTSTLPKTNSSHLKIRCPKRKFVFQPSIFRCELLVLGSVVPNDLYKSQLEQTDDIMLPFRRVRPRVPGGVSNPRGGVGNWGTVRIPFGKIGKA